jgi:glycosyltransferase involved in cell wall biosynthesis
MKLIDIIIPVYKAELTLAKALSSIAMQSITDSLKVTIVNDGDGIDYSQIIDPFKKFIDIEELRLEKNGGPGIARQYGIDNTLCKYIAFVDADDTLYGAFAMEMLLMSADSSPQCNMVVGEHYESNHKPELVFMHYKTNYVWVFAKLYRRSFLEKYNIRFNTSRINEDVAFNRMIELVTVDKIENPVVLDKVIYCWHDNQSSITRSDSTFLYGVNFEGYVWNMIYALKTAGRVRKDNKQLILHKSIITMFDIYIYFMDCLDKAPQFAESNFKFCVEYYNQIFQLLEMTQDSHFLRTTISNHIKNKGEELSKTYLQTSYPDFIIQLREASKKDVI